MAGRYVPNQLGELEGIAGTARAGWHLLSRLCQPAFHRSRLLTAQAGGLMVPPSAKSLNMPETAIVYEDVEVLEQDGLGLTCRIGQQRVFIGKYVPVDGTTVYRKGDRGTLALPRWFVEQQELPLRVHLSDEEVEEWAGKTERRAAAAREIADRHPRDPAAQNMLDRARGELNAALLIRGRRRRPD